MNKTRREFLGTGVAAVAATRAGGIAALPASTFVDIIRPPDFAAAYVEDDGRVALSKADDAWGARDIEVRTEAKRDGAGGTLSVSVEAPQSSLMRVHLRWLGRFPESTRFLGDHWERSYGDLEWRGFAGDRVMPWYFLAATGQGTHGYGVKTGGNSLCFWEVDADGIALWLDVRNGGSGVKLGTRRLAAAEVVARENPAGISPYHAACELCKALCEHPRLPSQPLYGSNNWYYLYGQNMTAEVVLHDSAQLAELSPVSLNAPYMVIDMGWGDTKDGAGPWTEEYLHFPEVPRLPAEMKKQGVRAGIWVRPLLSKDPLTKGWMLNRPQEPGSSWVLDPSRPEVLGYVSAGVHGITGWGYELVKHDFSTYDVLGRWGMQMGADLTPGGWAFADRSRTTAEILLAFYQSLRHAVGDAILLGCNTMGHLGAGLFAAQRIGDDTSGREWDRTRKMGVNTLAFRLPQHGNFFLADPDCAAISKTVPLNLTRQWLDLVARSGATLFISADPATVTAEERALLKTALAAAALSQPPAEPVDWMATTSPAKWRLQGKAVRYNWFGAEGVDFFPKFP